VAEPRRCLPSSWTTTLITLLRVVVRQLGHTIVGEAVDGQDALRVVRQEEPTVVVLDIDMPRMDGPTALPLLRDEFPTTYFLVFSLDERRREEAKEAGADAWVAKSSDLAGLFAAIRAAA
jgi:DNA-binding NarL/FixJ family response regulator